METTFHNVTITVEAPTPKDAYAKLCGLLSAKGNVEYLTDQYTTDDKPDAPESTERLWPE